MKSFHSSGSDQNALFGTGWLPPVPDLRDFTEYTDELKPINKKLGLADGKLKQAASVDLRKWCSPVENQGKIGSCTAHAAAGIIEYYERRAFSRHIEASRLFIYKVTRNLMQTTGDTGGWIRCTMGSLALCGVPAEKYWPYLVDKFDVEPPAFVYSVADNYEAVKYFRHDPVGGGQYPGSGHRAQGSGQGIARSELSDPSGTGLRANGSGEKQKGSEHRAHSTGENPNLICSGNKPSALRSVPCAPASKEHVLQSVKSYLEAGIPSMFGFWGFQSYDKSDTKGGIPFPAENESAQWGHAVVAVGYDDNKKIKNLVDGKETTGALLIRNSWGKEWGDNGYGWLPYEYVLRELALDFWSLVSMEWVETGQFGI